MSQETESKGSTINQRAIHVRAGDFSALVESMGPDALNQRFTVSQVSSESSPWALKPIGPEKTSLQVLEERHADRHDPGVDPDRMVILPSDREDQLSTPEATLGESQDYVFVPRRTTNPDGTETRRVERWKLTGEKDKNTGNLVAQSLVPEEKDGVMVINERELSMEALTPDVQAALEKQYEETARHTGHQTLESVEVPEPANDDEIDGNARMYSPEEMRAMRAGAAEVSRREAAISAEAPMEGETETELQREINRIDEEIRNAQKRKNDAYQAQLDAEKKYGTDSYEFKEAHREVDAAKDEIADLMGQRRTLESQR